jgi:hypothetical protein
MKPRWFDNQGAISIGCQNNGPEDHGLGVIKVDLVAELGKHVQSTHCDAVDHYALVLRVGGDFGDFAPERIHRIRRSRADRFMAGDIDVPVAAWMSRNTNELKGYLITRVSEALRLFAERLRRDGEKVDWPSLEAEAITAFRAFEQRAYPKAVTRR